MNDEQIEKVARAYSIGIGKDPDEMVGHSAEPDKNGYVRAILLHSPRWRLYVGEVKSYLAMKEAIDSINIESE